LRKLRKKKEIQIGKFMSAGVKKSRVEETPEEKRKSKSEKKGACAGVKSSVEETPEEERKSNPRKIQQ
jgi:hypothetical protein